MRVTALITAGGRGVRMGGSTPKQYLDLLGIPVLARTVILFQDHPLVEEIVITVPPGDEEYVTRNIVKPYALNKVAAITAGGRTRQHSVFNGLRSVSDPEVVAIHDGVRPLVRPGVITRTIETAASAGAAVACVAVKDTVKRRAGAHLETIPRSSLWLAHTPQAFRTEVILDAHTRAREDGFEGTDDSVLVERLGRPVEIVEDSEENLKITTPADMERAENILRKRG